MCWMKYPRSSHSTRLENSQVKQLKVILLALAVTFTGAVIADHKSEKNVEERTAPTGQVYRVGDDVPVAEAPVVEASGPRGGEEVYSTKCAMCHAAGIAGAPKAGDSAVWVDRIAQGEAILFDHAIKGFQGTGGFMPAKGGCSDCSDDEIKAAVKHIIDMSK